MSVPCPRVFPTPLLPPQPHLRLSPLSHYSWVTTRSRWSWATLFLCTHFLITIANAATTTTATVFSKAARPTTSTPASHATSQPSPTSTPASPQQPVDPISVAYPASAQAQGKWYIQGGFYLIGHTATYALDLTVPWKSSNAPWTQLPDSPDLSSTSCVVSLNNTFLFPYQQLNQTSPLLAIFGSEDPSQSFLALLDVSARKWVANATRVNPPKRNSGLVAIGNPIDGKIYTRGGYQSDMCNTMDVYDPKTDTLTPIPIPQPSTGGDIATGGVGVASSQWYGAVWSDRRSSILYFGGRLGSAVAYVPAVIYEYIPATNTWQFLSTTGTGPSGREDPCMAIDEANDNLVVYGGQITEGLLGDIYVLNLNTLEWKRGPSSSDGRVGMACTMHDDGFLVWGGAKDTFLLNIYSSEPGVFNLSTQQWTSTYKMTTPLELTPPVEKSKGSTLGLVLGLTMGGIAVGAVSAGMFLYKREKKKSDKSGRRLERIAKKSPSLSVPPDTSRHGHGHGHGHGPGYTNNKVHEEPSLPLEAHHRHRRNPSSGLEKMKSHVHFPREYDSSLGSTDDERNEPREWCDDTSRRKGSRRKKDLGMSIGHKIEMPMGPDNTSVQEHEHDHVYYDNKMEDPTFRAPSSMVPTPAPPVPYNDYWIASTNIASPLAHVPLGRPNDAPPGPVLASDSLQDVVDPRIVPQPPYNPDFMDGQSGSSHHRSRTRRE